MADDTSPLHPTWPPAQIGISSGSCRRPQRLGRRMRGTTMNRRRLTMLLKISAATTLVISIALGWAAPLAGTANAAVASISPQQAAAAGGVPAAMPLISLGVPAYTNDNCGGSTSAAWANDTHYDYGWRSCNTPSTAAPTYLAYDLSGVPAAQRGPVVVAWYNDPATLQYDYSYQMIE